MKRSLFKWLALSNAILALGLACASASLNKTIVSVNKNTIATLKGVNDPHVDFVQTMLRTATNKTSETTVVALLAAAWLAVNSVISWRCLSQQHADVERDPATPTK